MQSARLFQITLALGLMIGCSGLIAGCSALNGQQAVKPVPTELLPTMIAQTLEAKGIGVPLPEQTDSLPTGGGPAAVEITVTAADSTRIATKVAATITPIFTPMRASQTAPRSSSPTPTRSPGTTGPTKQPSGAPTLTTLAPSPTPTIEIAVTSVPGQATETPAPMIPDARIQIYWLGELSKVTAPIQVHARLTSQTGKVVRVELYGEDGRLLTRQVKTFTTIPWQVAGIDMELDFEISGAAEIGRLVISVEDIYGRLIDLNSVNLVLLSDGETVLNQSSALWQRIYIQEPANKTLIQGGTLTITGLARPDSDQPLRVTIVDESGRVLGQRLVGVGAAAPGGYGIFIAEVSYNISDTTPALVSVFEEGGIISSLSHLASIQVILSP